MKISLKRKQQLEVHGRFIQSRRELQVIHSYLGMLPIDQIADIRLFYEPKYLVNPEAIFADTDLDSVLESRFTQQIHKVLRDLEALYKNFLYLEKQEGSEAIGAVKLMLDYVGKLGAFVVRLLKKVDAEWRRFFTTTIKELKKRYPQ